MKILKIIHFPNDTLKSDADPVADVTDDTRELIEDMLGTMYAAKGVGLAAPQVGVLLRVIVIDVSENKDTPICLINPEIISRQGDVQWKEGCLSIPGAYETIDRSREVQVSALNQHGEKIEISADGLLSVCLQHEIDHLNGTLLVDHLSKLKCDRIRKKQEKITRQRRV